MLLLTNEFSLQKLRMIKYHLENMINKMNGNQEILFYVVQFPISLGYARTLHTAQGATL